MLSETFVKVCAVNFRNELLAVKLSYSNRRFFLRHLALMANLSTDFECSELSFFFLYQ